MSEISYKEPETLMNSSAITSSLTSPNDLKRTVKIQELPSMMNNHITPAGISRERSFVRSSNPQSHQISLVSVIFKETINLKPLLCSYLINAGNI